MRTKKQELISDELKPLVSKLIKESREKYNYSFLKDGGETYEWKSHKNCQFIVDCTWDYVDPYDGYTEDDFYDTCTEICSKFICPNCDKNIDDIDCEDDKSYCVDKIVNYFKEHEIVRINASTFEFRKRETNETNS